MIRRDTARTDLEGADGCDEAGFNSVVAPRPRAAPNATFEHAVVETPGVNKNTARAEDIARREFPEQDTCPQLQSMLEM